MFLKNLYSKLSLTIIVLLGSLNLHAQDPRFSQFYNAPLSINPALTGVFDGEYRIAGAYRNQWNSVLGNKAFQTYGFSGDYRYNVTDNDYIGIGGQLINEKSGQGDLNRFQANLSGSFIKQVGGSRYGTNDQYLVAGLQMGMGQYSTDWGGYWFQRQFNETNLSVNPNESSGENGKARSNLYLDFNAGLLWYMVFDDRSSVYAGGSMMHINTPKVSFFGENNEGNSLYRRWLGHAGGEFLITEYLSLLPSVYVMSQGPSFETVVGSHIRYSNNDWQELSIRAGGWARINNRLGGQGLESIIASLTFEFDRWNFGLSYDINASKLQTATNSRGAFEATAVYIAKENKRYRVKCPTF